MIQQIPQSNHLALSQNETMNLESNFSVQPLAVIVNPSGDTSSFAGELFELRVTVTNQGNISAVINIYIDETSGLLHQWCTSSYESLALADNSSAEVVFRFEIPVNAVPESYSYLLVIDAPKHYPEHTPIRHEAKLQILPPIQSALRVNDPTFTVLPVTTTTQPVTIEPGKPLDIKIIVNNRSSRVDRFRLTCVDFPSDWVTFIYPEGLAELGLVGERESLALNPGSKGEIILRLQLPLNILAGTYTPTVQLISLNNPDLVLISIVYLQVLPVYRLILEMQSIIERVEQEAGWFRLFLGNAGNTLRYINFTAQENTGKSICTYSFTPEQVELGAQFKTQIDLQVKPNKWWRRPWFGKGLPIQFYVEINDAYQLPIPDRLTGTLIWEARPLWQFMLLMFMGLGAIASLVFAIWWTFFRPSPLPKITDFTSVASTYQEATGDSIHLNWKIRHPQNLKTVKIIGIAADTGIVASGAVYHDFSQGIPPELKQFCTLESILNCQNIRTNAQQAGNYIFQMKIFTNKNEQLADSQKTNTIVVNAPPSPEIVNFTSTQPTYQEAAFNQTTLTSNNEIALNWEITNPEQLQELKLIGRSVDNKVVVPLKTYDFRQGIPSELSRSCWINSKLICQKVPTNARKGGDYIFELTAIPKRGTREKIITKKSDTIQVNSYVIPPKISSFSVNGQPALPKYIIPVTPQMKPINFRFNWQVEGGKDITVKLLPVPGRVALEGSIFYPISQQPGVEIIQLLVEGESGEKLSRTVAIEKVASPLPELRTNNQERLISRPLPVKIPTLTRTPVAKPSNLPITNPQKNQNPASAFPRTLPSPQPVNVPSPKAEKLPLPTPSPTISSTPLPTPLFTPFPSILSVPSPTPSPTPLPTVSPMESSPQFD